VDNPGIPNFRIREIPINGDLILSPMDGYSDMPFRYLCRQLGSAMSYTEFINAGDVIHGKRPHWQDRLAYNENERPVVFQIFDSDPDRLLNAALKLQDYHPDIIDINMGCSDHSVSNRGAGAGLLRTPSKIAEIFSKLSLSLSIPVTGKIRLGWDDCTRNFLLVSRIIEENGGQLIAVHARTRQQGYQGQADWDAIAEVKQHVSIPVIGNGDVRTIADIERIKNHTHCDGVMVGRAAIQNPWIFSKFDRKQVALDKVRSTMRLHLKLNLDFYGPERGLILFRKYAKKYLSIYPIPHEQMLLFMTATEADQFLHLLDQLVISIDTSSSLS
jgi:tRNA-dihydrouridine synthase B